MCGDCQKDSDWDNRLNSLETRLKVVEDSQCTPPQTEPSRPL